MPKKDQAKQSEKQGVESQPSALSDDDLDSVRGAGEFFEALVVETTFPTLDGKDTGSATPEARSGAPRSRKR